MENTETVRNTVRWLKNIVVGLNLCPFAGPVLAADSIQIEVSDATELEGVLADVLTQLDKIQSADEIEVATSILIFPHAMHNFDEYWAMAEIASDLLVEVGLDNIIQIATFHPEYCFDGVHRDDISNYTNRSPYPMLHFIREAQLTRALEAYSNPDEIPQNNIRRLEQLGKTEFLKLLAAK